MNFNAGQYNGLYGMSAQSNSFAWKGATKIKTSVTGTVSTFAYNPSKDEVESIASGLVVADPGTKKYDLSLSGGHQTITNAITSKLTPYFSTEYSVSLDIPELKTELPLDSFDQTAKLSFAVDNDGIAYYTYNFQREFEIDDVAFASSMQFAHAGE